MRIRSRDLRQAPPAMEPAPTPVEEAPVKETGVDASEVVSAIRAALLDQAEAIAQSVGQNARAPVPYKFEFVRDKKTNLITSIIATPRFN